MIIISLFCYDFICCKRYSIGEVLKHIFFRNPGIAKVLGVERDVKPRNMNFAKVDRRGDKQGGGVKTDKYGITSNKYDILQKKAQKT